MIEKIVLCTLRDNKGATGGPGGVLFMLKCLLGTDIEGIPCEYRFNSIKFGRRFKGSLNSFFFKLKCRFEKDIYYVAHDIEAGAILSDMGKPYSLVYHNQGPIVQEKINFGRQLSDKDIRKWSDIERKAFVNARSLHFPSSGAAEMFFNNPYASCTKAEVKLGAPLYNTIPDEQSHMVSGLSEDKNTITFFSLGTLTDAKGQDRSIQFVERFLEKNKEKKVRYIVVGRGPLQQLICDKGHDMMQAFANFQFLYFDRLPHNEVAYVHEIADVYLMLHRLSIFDFATLEAMVAKTAVVLSPIGGNLDFNKQDNIVFAESDYADAVEQLSPSNIDRLQKLNFEVFNRYFSAEAFAKAYREMIKMNVGG